MKGRRLLPLLAGSCLLLGACGLVIDTDPPDPSGGWDAAVDGSRLESGSPDAAVDGWIEVPDGSSMDSTLPPDDGGPLDGRTRDGVMPSDALLPMEAMTIDGARLGRGTCRTPIDLLTDVGADTLTDDTGRLITAYLGTTRAAVDNGEGSCTCAGVARDLVFQYTAPATGSLMIDTYGMSGVDSFDTVLYVREGSCTGRELACNDDADDPGAPLFGWPPGGARSQVQVNTVTAGTVYTIFVDGCGMDAAGDFGLVVRFEPYTAAGRCNMPIDLNAVASPTGAVDYRMGDTSFPVSHGEANDFRRCSCADMGWGLGGDLVFGYRAPRTGTYAFEIETSAYDAIIHLRTDCNMPSTEIACGDDPSSVTATLAAGDHVYLFADACRGFHRGGFRLNVFPPG